VLVGALALVYSAKASNIAKETLDVTRAQHELAEAQHDLDRRQFEQDQADRSAHAAFELSIDLAEADGDSDGRVQTTDGNYVHVRVRVGISNVGTRAAGPTRVSALIPKSLVSAHVPRWCDAGRRVLTQLGAATTSTEPAGVGASGASLRLDRKLDGVSTSAPEVLYFTFRAGPLSERGQEIPVRVRVQADESRADLVMDRVL
jgi:hypothetical protein